MKDKAHEKRANRDVIDPHERLFFEQIDNKVDALTSLWGRLEQVTPETSAEDVHRLLQHEYSLLAAQYGPEVHDVANQLAELHVEREQITRQLREGLDAEWEELRDDEEQDGHQVDLSGQMDVESQEDVRELPPALAALFAGCVDANGQGEVGLCLDEDEDDMDDVDFERERLIERQDQISKEIEPLQQNHDVRFLFNIGNAIRVLEQKHAEVQRIKDDRAQIIAELSRAIGRGVVRPDDIVRIEIGGFDIAIVLKSEPFTRLCGDMGGWHISGSIYNAIREAHSQGYEQDTIAHERRHSYLEGVESVSSSGISWTSVLPRSLDNLGRYYRLLASSDSADASELSFLNILHSGDAESSLLHTIFRRSPEDVVNDQHEEILAEFEHVDLGGFEDAMDVPLDQLNTRAKNFLLILIAEQFSTAGQTIVDICGVFDRAAQNSVFAVELRERFRAQSNKIKNLFLQAASSIVRTKELGSRAGAEYQAAAFSYMMITPPIQHRSLDRYMMHKMPQEHQAAVVSRQLFRGFSFNIEQGAVGIEAITANPDGLCEHDRNILIEELIYNDAVDYEECGIVDAASYDEHLSQCTRLAEVIGGANLVDQVLQARERCFFIDLAHQYEEKPDQVLEIYNSLDSEEQKRFLDVLDDRFRPDFVRLTSAE